MRDQPSEEAGISIRERIIRRLGGVPETEAVRLKSKLHAEQMRQTTSDIHLSLYLDGELQWSGHPLCTWAPHVPEDQDLGITIRVHVPDVTVSADWGVMTVTDIEGTTFWGWDFGPTASTVNGTFTIEQPLTLEVHGPMENTTIIRTDANGTVELTAPDA